MRYRVILHRQRRPADWQTFEVMHGAGEEMGHILEEADAILFDCITMYVNNMLMDHMKGITVETAGGFGSDHAAAGVGERPDPHV